MSEEYGNYAFPMPLRIDENGNTRSAFVIFFKQKTAYEISTRDWISDVCSSDPPSAPDSRKPPPKTTTKRTPCRPHSATMSRSEERRVGKEGRSRWSPYT